MSTTHTIADLRGRLFDAIDAVQNGKITVEQARTIGDLSQVIVNTAKAEIDFARLAERKQVPFLGVDTVEAPVVESAMAPPNGITSITRHVLAG